jgi:multidrug efflux pump
VVYLYMDRVRIWSDNRRARRNGGARPASAIE